MSITFSINGSAPEVKVYCKDRWPGLDDSDFEGYSYDRDEGGLYFMESAWPDINWSNANAYAMLRLLNMPVACCGSYSLGDLPSIRRNVTRLLNGELPDLRETVAIENQPRVAIASTIGTERVVQEGNCGFYDSGLLADDVRDRLECFLDFVMDAQEKNLGICWG
jgi:hypothetical protein